MERKKAERDRWWGSGDRDRERHRKTIYSWMIVEDWMWRAKESTKPKMNTFQSGNEGNTKREDLEISKNSVNKVCSLSENLSIRILRIYALFEYVLLLIKRLNENFF